MQVPGNETLFSTYNIYCDFIYNFFLSYFFSLQASKLYLSLQNEIYRGKTHGQ